MHYLKGRHRWIIAAAIAIVLAAAALTSYMSRQDTIPMAPGPLPTAETLGSM